MRVLIVEDERRLAENIARSLRESAGYAVDCCCNGEDGLYMAENNPYDLLILDLMIPNHDRKIGDRIDGWWNRDYPPQDSRSGPWSMSRKEKQNLYEGKSKTPHRSTCLLTTPTRL